MQMPEKSGVVLNRREALRQLLEDVDLGKTGYRAILIYDVSRWGRFQNSDEAAHYEFLCTRSGIRLHYCAEQFINDDTPSSAILKALKRSMAAEFSRELGVKVFEGKSRLVKLGFWVGGAPGYGYRRMMVSATGKPKQKLKSGEHKSLTTDRIILVPGPRKEVECVRRMFGMVLQHRLGCTAIARDLNRDGIPFYGGHWRNEDVFNVLTNPKYAGWNAWNRTSQKLRSNVIRVQPDRWILRQGAFASIIDQHTFDRLQARLPRNADRLWSDQELLNKLKRLLAAKGRLSEKLILKARGMPSTCTLR
jgi:DNA invertase Pin-like site-specific DNA recombinase